MPACVHTYAWVHPIRRAAHRPTWRAAWASTLNVSSTRPTPSSGLESVATRRVVGSVRWSYVDGWQAVGCEVTGRSAQRTQT